MRLAFLILGFLMHYVFSQEDQCRPINRFPVILGTLSSTYEGTYATAMEYNHASNRIVVAGYSDD